ncbi:ribonuclease P protein component [Rasiella rasia]|uniref:Ribonuclease P protein component n=1 Tax=Rasiella rasia TaxID=2744027 RepID=A0A6G6GMR6_9FLAO|nr:ribonuclease P protein component [Rasiella rasia]QIE59876.1 ribonuclease P protein component [Rasiella rasia]
MPFTFGKDEKLKSRKRIAQLFDEGETVVKFPIKVFYLPLENSEVSQATFAVPKRSFKSAVARNRIKRQLREAYRLQKEVLEKENGKHFTLLFLYLSKDKPQYSKLSSSMAVLLKKISE